MYKYLVLLSLPILISSKALVINNNAVYVYPNSSDGFSVPYDTAPPLLAIERKKDINCQTIQDFPDVGTEEGLNVAILFATTTFNWCINFFKLQHVGYSYGSEIKNKTNDIFECICHVNYKNQLKQLMNLNIKSADDISSPAEEGRRHFITHASCRKMTPKIKACHKYDYNIEQDDVTLRCSNYLVLKNAPMMYQEIDLPFFESEQSLPKFVVGTNINENRP